MASSRKKQEEAKNRRRQHARQAGERPTERSESVTASFVKIDIQREIEHIIHLAQARESRLVTLGDFVLFSTRTRDAWLLDREDDFAVCLCWDGESQPVTILDDSEIFVIEWTAKFEVEGAAFIVYEHTGRVLEVEGYPTAEISAACRR